MAIKNHAFFIVERLALMKVISQLKGSIGRHKCLCELTIINDLVSFNVPGATFAVNARTKGSAKASFEFKTFYQILETYELTELKIEIVDDHVIIDKFSFESATTFFEDDKILRSIILPMNFTDLDLLSISAGDRYTIEEMRFNKVFDLVNQADIRLEQNLDTAARALKNYGIKRKEIEQLINKKVQRLLDSNANALNIQRQIQDKDSPPS